VSASQETPPYAELLPDLYRFAFLMTGSAEVAAEVLQIGVERSAHTLRQVRDAGRAKRWLFSQARLDCSAASGHANGRCLFGADETQPCPEAPVPAVFNDQPRQLALVFAILPEPERCALALFYLYILTPRELGEVMDLKPSDLGTLLSHGRSLLQRNRTLNGDLLTATTAAPFSV
jgi:DNA-directed RNA polymerase specialized sigma24 family protein